MTDRYITVPFAEMGSSLRWLIIDTAEGRVVAETSRTKHDAVSIAAALNLYPIPEERF